MESSPIALRPGQPIAATETLGSSVDRSTVSIVVPAYNPGTEIAELIAALQSQTAPFLEIVIVDDASDVPIADQLPTDAAVRVIRLKERTGAGGARAAGVAATRGEIVAFTDVDCRPPVDWLAKILATFGHAPEAIAVSGGYTHAAPISAIDQIAVLEQEYVFRFLAEGHATPIGGNMAIRRAAWERARTGREEIYFRRMASGEDTVLSSDLRRHGRIVYEPELNVAHVGRDGAGYFRRHINRGRSGMLIALFGLVDADPKSDSLTAHGGRALALGNFALAAGLIGVAVGFATQAAGWFTAAALFIAAYLILSSSFMKAARQILAARHAATWSRLLLLRGVLLVRQACWGYGAFKALGWVALKRIRKQYNIFASIAHFWAPGKISKLFYFVTSQCNARCNFCFNLDNVVNWSKRKPTELTLDEIRRVAASADRLPYITLSGGEPFVRPDLVDVVEAFHTLAHTFWVTIPTNAALTRHVLNGTRNILTRCPEVFLTIQVSLDSLHEDHDRSRKIKGGFEALSETLHGLAMLRRVYPNLRIQIGTVYGAFNVARIREIAEYCRTHFEVDQHLFGLIRAPRTLISHEDDALVHGYIDFLREHEERTGGNHRGLWARAVRALNGITYADLLQIRLSEKFLRPCAATQKFATLYDDGRVTPCEVLETTDCGNVRNFDCDLRALLNHKDVKRLHREQIVKAKCNCEWVCAIPINVLYDVSTYWRVAKAFFSPTDVIPSK